MSTIVALDEMGEESRVVLGYDAIERLKTAVSDVENGSRHLSTLIWRDEDASLIPRAAEMICVDEFGLPNAPQHSPQPDCQLTPLLVSAVAVFAMV